MGKMDQFIKSVFEKTADGLLDPAVSAALIKDYQRSRNSAAAFSVPAKDIAIIGMSCRFSRSGSPEQWWENIKNGRNLLSDVPWGRWPGVKFTEDNHVYCGSFIDDFDCFDNDFFQLTDEEARATDPQQRQLLELCWELMERGGYGSRKSRINQCIAMFIGARGNTYKVGSKISSSGNAGLSRSTLLGQAPNMIAAKIADFMDFNGPALVLDTACSSSLISVHAACWSLLLGECSMAIAGGVEFLNTPEIFYYLKQIRALSPDGCCHTFDKKANGYVPGEGAVLFLLKPLDLALQQGDTIFAVIKGSAINNDGYTVGVTTPSVEGQKQVIQKALQNAGIGAETISLVEAHGTATFIGDPIEFKALTSLFREYTDKNNYCALGSVKTNMGHSHCASGAAGLLKIVLALYHKIIPPSLHFKEPNPRFHIVASPFYVPDHPVAWNEDRHPRRAGVSAFGFGGTNCHMIVEEAPVVKIENTQNQRSCYVLQLSAMNTQALADLVETYKNHLAKIDITKNGPVLSDLCFTANACRQHHQNRLALCFRDIMDLGDKLKTLSGRIASSSRIPDVFYARVPEVADQKMVWLFPDQGSLYPQTARELYFTEPNFKKSLDTCDRLFLPYLKKSLIDILYNSDCADLDETILTPAWVFSISYSLAQMWLSWGLQPAALLGHSIGEYTAAVIAGVVRLEDAVKMVVHRSRLMQNAPAAGGMAVVVSDPDTVLNAIKSLNIPAKQTLGIAAYNGPCNTVVSGNNEALETLIQYLKKAKIKTIVLPVSSAFHSSLMKPMADEYRKVLNEITFSQAQIPVVSNVTGDFQYILDKEHWLKQIVHPVLFAPGIKRLADEHYSIFLEVGPGATLASLMKTILTNDQDHLICSTLHRQKTDWQSIWEAVAVMWIRGIDIDMEYIDKPLNPRRMLLPSYPFQRKRFWIEQTYLDELWNTQEKSENRNNQSAQCGNDEGSGFVPKVEEPRCSNGSLSDAYTKQCDFYNEPILRQHVLFGRALVPGVVFWEMIHTYAGNALQKDQVCFGRVHLLSPLYIEKNATPAFHVTVNRDAAVSIKAGAHEHDKLLVKGTILQSVRCAEKKYSVQSFIESLPSHFRGRDIYEKLAAKGLHYGPAFQTIMEGWGGDRRALVRLQLPHVVKNTAAVHLYRPLLFDGALQGILCMKDLYETPEVYAPFYAEELLYHADFPEQVFGYIDGYEKKGAIIHTAVKVFDSDATLLAEVNGLRLKAISGSSCTMSPINKSIYSTVLKKSSEAWVGCIQDFDVKKDILFGNQIEQLCSVYAVEFLKRYCRSGTHDFVVSDLLKAGKIQKKYLPLIRKMILMAREDNWVEEINDGYYRIVTVPEQSADALSEQICEEYRENAVFVNILGHCLKHYPDTLAGKLNPAHVLFPSGNSSMLGNLYKLPSPVYTLVEKVLSLFLTAADNGRKMRILEVGAGTGGLTTHIHALLKKTGPEYFFTDISAVLVDHAKQKFNVSNMNFTVLDINTDPVAQGFNLGYFDMVIAANVIHATKNLSTTFAHIKRLLRPRGTMILVETTHTSRFADLVFGLTEEFWDKNGSETKNTTVLRTASEWKNILISEGFEQSAVLAENMHTIRHPLSVVIAQKKDGISAAPKMGPKQPAMASTIDTWFYKPVWVKQMPVPGEKIENRTLVIFAHKNVWHEKLLARLQEEKRYRIVTVYPGDSFQSVSKDCFLIHPEKRQDYGKLVQEFSENHIHRYRILHLWTFKNHEQEKNTCGNILHSQYTGSISLIYIIQSLLNNAAASQKYTVYAVTAYVHSVTGKEKKLFPEHATLAGIAKTLEHECRKITIKLLDLDIDEVPNGTYIDQIIQEMQSRSESRIVAYRHNQRFVNKILPVQSFGKEKAGITLKQRGVYIVAGGLGGIGLEIAHYLAQKVAARLVLISRSSIPPQSQWNEWLKNHEHDEAIVKKIKKLQKIQAAGSTVLIINGDITNSDQMKRMLQQTKESFSEIHGIIHAAGVLNDSMLITMTDENFLNVLLPKMVGSFVLDQVSAQENLDFFIIFSGLISLFGNSGQANHCAADCFQDAFAHYRNNIQNKRTLSINWGIWEEIGVVGNSRYIDPLKEKGLLPIKTKDGLAAFEKALETEEVQIAIAPLEHKLLKTYGIPSHTSTDVDTKVNHFVKEKEIPQRKDIKTVQTFDALVRQIQEMIILQLRELPGLEAASFSSKDSFLEHGMDSLTIVSFTQKFASYAGLELFPTIFFEYPTVQQVSHYLAKEYTDHFTEMFLHQDTQTADDPCCDGTGNRRLLAETPSVSFTEEVPHAVEHTFKDSDIAVIGMSGMFPQARTVCEFWDNLCNGVDSIQEIPGNRWDIESHYRPQRSYGKTYCKWAGIIDGIDQFDPHFFNISPREAISMDPQQRLFLTIAWQVLEDAGYAGKRIYGSKTGVFVGVSKNDYRLSAFNPGDIYSGLANSESIVANRVSHFLNSRGPSIAINTQCSSSLVAVHLACQSIVNGESDYAIAGGVHLVISSEYYILLSQMEALSLDGKCKSFDKRANGFVSGEGVGAVMLKKLSQAVRDGDNIHAVIKATAVNHTGRSGSLSAPSAQAQSEVIQQALVNSGVASDSISYIETHGTGTQIGDPIEIRGLMNSIGRLTDKRGFCGIGSVKTNIGHLDAAAGIASLIKVIMAMKNRTLPPHLHFNQINPYLDLSTSPFYIVDTARKWHCGAYPLRAGISSFGMGGTNGHIIMEEAPSSVNIDTPAKQSHHIVALSTRDEKNIHAMVEALRCFIEKNPDVSIQDMCYTLNTGREHFQHRVAFIVDDIERLYDKLRYGCQQAAVNDSTFNSAVYWGKNHTNTVSFASETAPAVVMVLPELSHENTVLHTEFINTIYQNQQVFHNVLDRIYRIVPDLPDTREWFQNHEIHRPDIMLFAVQYTLASMIIDWVITPSTFHGSGNGALVAHVLAGGMSIEDAVFSLLKQENSENLSCGNHIDWHKPSLFLTIGPGDAFTASCHDNFKEKKHTVFSLFDRKGIHWKSLYSFLGSLYVIGADIDWENVYLGQKCRKISLPTYPFNMQRYWRETTVEPVPKTRSSSEQNPDCFMRVCWEEVPFLSGTATPLKGSWIVFGDCLGLSPELEKHIESVISVQKGEFFEQISTTQFHIDPTSEKDYIVLFDTLVKNNTVCNGVIHLWSFSPFVRNAENVDTLEKSFYDGLYSLFFTAKALSALKQTTRVVVVSSFGHGHSADSSRIAVEKSPLGVLLHAVSREQSTIIGKVIDFNDDLASLDMIAQTVINEIHDDWAFDEVVYRNHKRLRKTLARLTLNSMCVQQSDIWKKNGVYVITGGTSGIGAVIAAYLAGNYAATLILIGRTSLTDTHEDTDSPAAAKKRLVRSLQKAGSTVIYVAMDISNASEVEKKLQRVKKEVGFFNGVLHCAGMNSDKPVTDTSFSAFKTVLAPKVHGTVLLSNFFKHEPLDFFVAFSSIAAVFGTPGQSGYSAANAWMDSYMTKLVRAGTINNAVSVNWGFWEHGGMKPSALSLRKMEKDGLLPLSNDFGIACLETIIQAKNSAAVIVLPVRDQKQFLKKINASQRRNEEIDYLRNQPHNEAEAAAGIEQQLAEIFGEVLAMKPEEIDTKEHLETYGMDSLAVKSALFKMEQRYGEYFEPSILYQYPSIASLTLYFVQKNSGTGQCTTNKKERTALVIDDALVQAYTEKNDKRPLSSNAQHNDCLTILNSLSEGTITHTEAKDTILSILGKK